MTHGEVDFGRIPAAQVEQQREADIRTQVWFEGVDEGVDVWVYRTAAGLRFRLPLTFLRAGSEVLFAGREGTTCRGTLTRALLGATRAQQAPVLQVEVATPLSDSESHPA